MRPASADLSGIRTALAAAGVIVRRPRDPAVLPDGAIEAIDWGELGLLERWRSPGLMSMVRDLTESPLRPGSFAADPRASAAARVAAVRLRHGLDEDAAALLLQLRAMPDPTPERVCRWNGWTPAQQEVAAATLLARGLVVRRLVAGTTRALYPDVRDDTPIAQAAAARFAAAVD